jgi:hypothetical protein
MARNAADPCPAEYRFRGGGGQAREAILRLPSPRWLRCTRNDRTWRVFSKAVMPLVPARPCIRRRSVVQYAPDKWFPFHLHSRGCMLMVDSQPTAVPGPVPGKQSAVAFLGFRVCLLHAPRLVPFSLQKGGAHRRRKPTYVVRLLHEQSLCPHQRGGGTYAC